MKNSSRKPSKRRIRFVENYEQVLKLKNKILQIIKHQKRVLKDLIENGVINNSRDDTDSGVICTDVNTDLDNTNEDEVEEESVKALDSLKHSDTGSSRRVFLNHRNITKMKDIKYKRITKTKSKSMEELRDKLRDSPFAVNNKDDEEEGSDIGFSFA